ncbi:MAG TPA: glycosyl hydrolase family 32 [Bacteroidales bacterium]|nr:glycosyl hydrolase family 32 [Bacteroidales bacterium]
MKIQKLLFLLFCIITTSCGSGKNNKRLDANPEQARYPEKYRPQFHFSPETGWMNDPNGMVYYGGEYHLFYQYYPDSTVWGPMHWGHAISTDLVHWTHMPVALYPDSLGYIFSGSAVTDAKNSSGFGTGSNPPLVAIFTYHNSELEKGGSNTFQSQGIAWSIDKGRTWTKYSGNPVLPNPGKRDFRDPKVFWHKETGKWIMILAVHDRVNLFSSADLKSWSFESEFGADAGAHGGVWECPDLFPLKVFGSDDTKWVMLVSINPGGPNGGSATQYFTGEFDGSHFTADEKAVKWIDWGTDNYAGVTWSDIPEADGRRLFLGWMSNWNYATVVPTSLWRSAMTIPRELILSGENGKYFLISRPVSELSVLKKEVKSIVPRVKDNMSDAGPLIEDPGLNQCEIEFEYRIPDGYHDSLGIILENNIGEQLVFGFSVEAKLIFIDRTNSGNTNFSKRFVGVATAPYESGKRLKMHLFIDASSAELFIDEGKLVMTSLFFAGEKYSKLRFFSKNPGSFPEIVNYYTLESIWADKKSGLKF